MDGELQVLLGEIKVIVLIVGVVIHMKAGALTPDLPALRDLVEALDKGLIALVKILSRLAFGML